jgi:biopolymer transport protein ExbD
VSNIRVLFSAAFLTLVCSAASCAWGATYEHAANRYCKLYSPDSWENSESRASLQEVYGFIVSEAMNIDNAQFRNDIEGLEADSFYEFHGEIHRVMESRLGKSWKCPDFDDFFYPKQTVIELDLGKVVEHHIDPGADDTLVIVLAGSGDIFIDNHPLANTSTETMERALALTLNGKAGVSTRVYLYLDEGADGGKAFGIFQLLKAEGIESIGLIGYSTQ